MTRTDTRDDTHTARTLERQALFGTGLSVPSTWDIVDVREGDHDGLPVTVVRRQPDGYRLGGPHATVVADRDGRLLGYTCLRANDPADLLDRAESRRAAFDLIRRAAGAYADDLAVQWIKRHDETVAEADGSVRAVTGMKVKTRHADGRYTWAVVGPGGTVLTYERGISWDAARARRGTPMWLHDKWIAAHDGLGPQPEPPYATAH
ncbi:hypothetical protein [Glycomyces niveus]|jgi:hypothetical protein|uniref:Uncharacterized protein n=1 Tax=Glycomyces niveus TaxID=2820287 RepID=A0ABS3U890_9ACTN|nr:hypothetical protein [Glycomyces sp. NEAU-S30]MBO3734985.1 hypothetical protein [Glycomyces sp. NEAU-S30]